MAQITQIWEATADFHRCRGLDENDVNPTRKRVSAAAAGRLRERKSRDSKEPVGSCGSFERDSSPHATAGLRPAGRSPRNCVIGVICGCLDSRIHPRISADTICGPMPRVPTRRCRNLCATSRSSTHRPIRHIIASERVQQCSLLCPDTLSQMATTRYLAPAIDDGSLREDVARSNDLYRARGSFLVVP